MESQFGGVWMARRGLTGGLLFALFLAGQQAGAVDIDELKREVLRIREEISQQDDPKLSPVSRVDEAVYDKYGPEQAVKTRCGKLTFNGLVQIWYQHITNDNVGIIT